MNRRLFIKNGAISALGLTSLSLPTHLLAQETHGITGKNAPELNVPQWINGKGKPQKPFSIHDNHGKWIYLKCFQEWCPACHSVGFPNLQKLVNAFPDDQHVAKEVIQTTFEGFSSNTFSALRKNQLRYDLDLPFGHDPGNIELPRNNHQHYPNTMVSYGTGGTPWVVLINPEGVVVFSNFHINIDKLIPYLKQNIA